MTPPGNPAKINSLTDLGDSKLRFINRQSGAGTRVWLDARLRQLGVNTNDIQGYRHEVLTHTEVAEAVKDKEADIGLGIETAARTHGLGFVSLDTERYDLVIPEVHWEHPVVITLTALLKDKNLKAKIEQMGGYDLSLTGTMVWVS
jgi:putative molybdopterin biosynthesis protein